MTTPITPHQFDENDKKFVKLSFIDVRPLNLGLNEHLRPRNKSSMTHCVTLLRKLSLIAILWLMKIRLKDITLKPSQYPAGSNTTAIGTKLP